MLRIRADAHAKPHGRVPMNASNTLYRANTCALAQRAYNYDLLVRAEYVLIFVGEVNRRDYFP